MVHDDLIRLPCFGRIELNWFVDVAVLLLNCFVVNGDRAEERIVTTGQKTDQLVEIVTGLKNGERVATANVNQLVDGVKVR